jgi:5-methylthioribose kinase
MFLNQTEALVHGDLHTGSIMATRDDTRMIDPEFAFYGPMGFDLGAVLANFYLAYFAQEGHEQTFRDRDDYREWLLGTAEQVWMEFTSGFLRRWRETATGDAYPAELFRDPASGEALARERATFVRRLLGDSLGFAGIKMLRRIFGVAHVEDLESIADPDRRALCERKAVRLGRELVVNAHLWQSLSEVSTRARQLL